MYSELKGRFLIEVVISLNKVSPLLWRNIGFMASQTIGKRDCVLNSFRLT